MSIVSSWGRTVRFPPTSRADGSCILVPSSGPGQLVMSLMSCSRLDISFSWLWSGVRTSGTFSALYGVHIGRWELEGVGEGACDGTLLICWLALACCLWFRLEMEAEGEASAEAWWAGEGAFDKEFHLGPKRELIERLGGSIIRTCSQNNGGTRDWKWKQKTEKTKELVGGCKRKKGVAVPIVAFDERSTPSLTSKASLLSLRNTVENMASTCCSSPSSIQSLILLNNAGVAQSGITANSPPRRGRKISKKMPSSHWTQFHSHSCAGKYQSLIYTHPTHSRVSDFRTTQSGSWMRTARD